jgi:hypothetical protein
MKHPSIHQTLYLTNQLKQDQQETTSTYTYFSAAVSSQGASGGAAHPPPLFCVFHSTFAPYGGSFSNSSDSTASAWAVGKVGGSRRLSTSFVVGRKTLPASDGAGSPSAPVTASCGRHQRLSANSPRLGSSTGPAPPVKGKRLTIPSWPRTLAAAVTCRCVYMYASICM